MIRICTEEPDYSALPTMEYEWAHSVYGTVTELQKEDWPTPRGNYITLLHFVDANLYHDIVTGRSVTGILHLVNKTPIEWYSKKQGTVETATFGSEFAAARTCTEQIIDLHDTLRYMGVPIRDKSYMFGDNKTVVDSSNTPHGKLHKRRSMLAYHQVQEAITSENKENMLDWEGNMVERKDRMQILIDDLPDGAKTDGSTQISSVELARIDAIVEARAAEACEEIETPYHAVPAKADEVSAVLSRVSPNLVDVTLLNQLSAGRNLGMFQATIGSTDAPKGIYLVETTVPTSWRQEVNLLCFLQSLCHRFR